LTSRLTNGKFGHADDHMKRVTHRDIAQRLGLSQSAVSRALADSPKIPLKTRRQIRAAAEEMGYHPNSLLSELAASRWQGRKIKGGEVIAYIDRIRRDAKIGTNISAPLQKQTSLLGYQLEVFHREDFASSSKLQRVLRNRGITDIILGAVYEKSLTVELDWSKFICVQLFSGFFQLPFHSVARDHFNAVVLAWTKAVTRGYQRIGISLLEHPTQLMDDFMRASAVRACQMELFPHLPALPPYMYLVAAHSESDFTAWVKENRPDVLIGFTDGQYLLYQEKFGHKTAYINLHRFPLCETSGILEDVEQCAREAVNLLHFCRRTFQWGIPKIRIDHLLEPRWAEGHSLPPKGQRIPDGPLPFLGSDD
jgi:LacI family transcriptional regulator